MLCIKLHPPNIENAPPSEPKLHPLHGFYVSIKIREPLIQSQERSARDFVPN